MDWLTQQWLLVRACVRACVQIGSILLFVIIAQLALTFGLKRMETQGGHTIQHFLKEIYKELAMVRAVHVLTLPPSWTSERARALALLAHSSCLWLRAYVRGV
jgi:hypothetical protein